MYDWGANPDPLSSAGAGMAGLEPDAKSAGKGFLDSVTDAGAAVHHHVLRGALESYHGRWAPAANRLAWNVGTAGSNVKSTAATLQQGDNHAAHAIEPSAAAATSLEPLVTKQITL